jgi:hypothetical protein
MSRVSYCEIEDSKYRCKLNWIDNIEDSVGIVYSSDEIREMGIREGIKRNVIEEELNGIYLELKKLEEKGGKVKSVVISDELVDVFVDGDYYYCNNVSDYDSRLRRIKNRIYLKKEKDESSKEREELKKGDFRNLMDIFVGMMNKKGFNCDLRISYCSSSIGSVNLMKKCFSWDEIEKFVEKERYGGNLKMMKKLYEENDVELRWGS